MPNLLLFELRISFSLLLYYTFLIPYTYLLSDSYLTHFTPHKALINTLTHSPSPLPTTMAATIINAKAPIRVALLVCGTPIPAVAEPYGEYPAIFNNLLQDGLKELKERKTVGPDTELVLEGFDVREDKYPERLSDYDGILISGSGMCHLPLASSSDRCHRTVTCLF